MARLKKLLITMLLSLIALGFTISVYGGLSNPFSSKLDEKTVKSLDNVVELVKSKGSGLSNDSYSNLVSRINDRLKYLSYEMDDIQSSLSLGNNDGSSVNHPAIFPNQKGPVAQNANALALPYKVPRIENGIKYNYGYDDGIYNQSDKSINNKTIFGSISNFSDFFGSFFKWPGGGSRASNGSSNVFYRFNLKNHSYLSLEFNTTGEKRSGRINTTMSSPAYGPASSGILISISDSPGDFNYNLNQDNCIQNGAAEGQLNWSTDSNANNKYANAGNPDARDGFYCILEKNKKYYINFVHLKNNLTKEPSCVSSPYGNAGDNTGVEPKSCGVLGQMASFPYGDYIFENSK